MSRNDLKSGSAYTKALCRLVEKMDDSEISIEDVQENGRLTMLHSEGQNGTLHVFFDAMDGEWNASWIDREKEHSCLMIGTGWNQLIDTLFGDDFVLNLEVTVNAKPNEFYVKG